LLPDGDDLVVRHDDDAVGDRRRTGAVDQPRGAQRDGAAAFRLLGLCDAAKKRRG
jgi:hypothetical protein